MNGSRICAVIAFFTVLAGFRASGQQAAPAAAPAQAGPRIAFDSPVFDFGKAPAGELIKHTFYFTNTGVEKLVLHSVNPACGCTAAADWTREVAPGGFGQVPIQFNTANFTGPVAKGITVASNDKQQPSLQLQIKGTVWKPIEISPSYAVMNLQPDSTSGSTTVTITNNTDGPVHFYQAEVNNAAFVVQLKTNVDGKAYQVDVSAIAPLKPGSTSGQITIRSTLASKPVETVTAWLNVQPPVTVVPPTVNLAAAPLNNAVSPVITIINNTAIQMALTNAKVNVEGVNVQVKEMQAGKYLTVTLGFPVGFEAPQGVAMEFTADTNNPKHPAIRVPIYQTPKPAAAAQTTYIPVPAPAPSPSAPPQAAALRTVVPRAGNAAVQTAPLPPAAK